MRILFLLLISCAAFGQQNEYAIHQQVTGKMIYPVTSGTLAKVENNAAPIQSVPVPKVTVLNNVAVLTFTGTNVGAFQWNISPAASASVIYGGADYAAKNVTLKTGVKYTFTLVTWDRAGNKPLTASVVYDNSVPIVPVPKKDTAYQITLFDANGKRFTTINVFKDTSISKQ